MAIALGYLGECLLTQKRYDEAEPLLTESAQILERVHVPQSPVTAAMTKGALRITDTFRTILVVT